MYAVTSPERGVLEVNYMWLPSWVGMNTTLLTEMGEAVRAATVGKPVDVAFVAGHEAVVNFITAKHPEIKGLREYLDALTYVRVDGEENTQE